MEDFSPELLSTINTLNDKVIASGVKMEGNLFYLHHHELRRTRDFYAPFAPKRKQIVDVVKGKKHILEIGFNAGHSAALILTSNDEVRYSAIDICYHKYTKPCAASLFEKFGDRFAFYEGDSAHAYPYHFRSFLDCDLVHIDGGHSLEMFRIDTLNAIFMPRDKSIERHLLIDDVDLVEVRDELKRFVDEGYLEIEQREGFNDDHHVICKIVWNG